MYAFIDGQLRVVADTRTKIPGTDVNFGIDLDQGAGRPGKALPFQKCLDDFDGSDDDDVDLKDACIFQRAFTGGP